MIKSQDFYREKILELHEKYGVAYTFMAGKIGISSTYISKWMRGYDFAPETFQKLVAYYDNLPFKQE